MIPIIIYSAVFVFLFLITDYMYLKQHYPADFTRKLAHITSGIISLTFPIFLVKTWQTGVLCGSFLGLLVIAERFKLFPSITAVKRKTWGSWLFPLAILTCYFFMKLNNREAFFYVPMAILTVSDTMANLMGKQFPIGLFKINSHQKTIMGSSAFFVSTMAILFFASSGFSITEKLIITTVITFVEAVSIKGLDNITIPLGAIGMLYLFTI